MVNISSMFDPSDVDEIAPNTEIEPTPIRRECLGGTAPHSYEEIVALYGPPQIDTGVEFTFRINTRLEIFKRCSDPLQPFYTREARDVCRLHDDFLERDDHAFPLKIGETGRLVITLQGPRHIRMPLHVYQVTLRTGNDCVQPLDFIQRKNAKEQTEIVASLHASLYNWPRLREPCPNWGDVNTRYVPMNVIIDAFVGEKHTKPYEWNSPIYFKVMPNKRTPLLDMIQEVQRTWEKAPQLTRTVVKIIARVAVTLALACIPAIIAMLV